LTPPQTETYVALKLLIDNWRWVGVPFFARANALPKRTSEPSSSKQALAIFRDTPVEHLTRNLVIHIQPMVFVTNGSPWNEVGCADKVEMNFHSYCTKSPAPDDCMIGDATLFQRADNTEAGWRVVEPIFDVWSGEAPQFPNYAAGTWGPKEADDLLAKRRSAVAAD